MIQLHRKDVLILTILFSIIVCIRMFAAYQTAMLDDSSYELLRQVDHIAHTGLPLVADELSFGGRERVINPILYYPLALVWKIVPSIEFLLLFFSILQALICIPVYLFVKTFIQSHEFATIVGFIAGLSPMSFLIVENTLSLHSLIVPLLFLVLYCLLTFHEPEHKKTKVIFLTFVAISTPLFFLPLLAIILYMLYMTMENKQVPQEQKEIVFYVSLVAFFSIIIFYREVLFTYGLRIPFSRIFVLDQSIFIFFSKTSIILFLAASYVIYRCFSHRFRAEVISLFGFISVCGVIFLFSLLDIATILYIFQITMIITIAYVLNSIYSYVELTRLSKYAGVFARIAGAFFIIVICVPTYVFFGGEPAYNPSVSYASVNEVIATNFKTVYFDENYAGDIIQANSSETPLIIVHPYMANEVMYYTNSQTLADANSLLVLDYVQRLEVINLFYKTSFSARALQLIDPYVSKNGNYIIWQSSYSSEYLAKPQYLATRCFPLRYKDDYLELYEVTCQLR
jgi:hypothetical protein